MREFLLTKSEMTTGKFSPQPVLFDFGVAQAVIVGRDLGLERRSPLFRCLFQKQLVQDGGLGAEVSLSCLLLQVGETLRREGEGASPLGARVPVWHNTLYHTLGMTVARGECRPLDVDDERNDSINNVGSQARVDFGGANQPKARRKGAEHADYRV